MSLQLVRYLWCLYTVGWAVLTDIRYHKIKNRTVLFGMAGGFLLNLGNIRASVLGVAVPLLLIVFFALNMMGAGDIKLLCSVGAIIQFPCIVDIILYSFVFCGVHILFRAMKQNGLRDLFNTIRQDFIFMFLTRSLKHGTSKDKRLPMAGSIAAASLLVIVQQAIKAGGDLI